MKELIKPSKKYRVTIYYSELLVRVIGAFAAVHETEHDIKATLKHVENTFDAAIEFLQDMGVESFESEEIPVGLSGTLGEVIIEQDGLYEELENPKHIATRVTRYGHIYVISKAE